jgi:hypothetical protein
MTPATLPATVRDLIAKFERTAPSS